MSASVQNITLEIKSSYNKDTYENTRFNFPKTSIEENCNYEEITSSGSNGNETDAYDTLRKTHGNETVDYDTLRKTHGSETVDYDSLRKTHGNETVDYDSLRKTHGHIKKNANENVNDRKSEKWETKDSNDRDNQNRHFVHSTFTSQTNHGRTWKIFFVISLIICLGLTCALVSVSVLKSSAQGLTCALVSVSVLKSSAQDTPCTRGPCFNAGQCFVEEDDYICVCPGGFYGLQCETTPCDSSPCYNNGTCIVNNSSFTCFCPCGNFGNQCQDDLCTSSPCLNNGTCLSRGDRYDCSCGNGYYGDRCETTPCDSSPCYNNGTCIVNNSSFTCFCPCGNFGNQCQDDICTSSPCLNNGTCLSRGDRYDCSCGNGYYGDRCEKWLPNDTLFVVSWYSFTRPLLSGDSSTQCIISWRNRAKHTKGETIGDGIYIFFADEGSYVKSIHSPGFPSDYPHSLSQIWNINVGSGYVAVLRFKNFSTEYGYDYVTVYNGPSDGSKLLYTWCGKIVPIEMRTTGQHLTLKMTTDSSVHMPGFAADVYMLKQ